MIDPASNERLTFLSQDCWVCLIHIISNCLLMYICIYYYGYIGKRLRRKRNRLWLSIEDDICQITLGHLLMRKQVRRKNIWNQININFSIPVFLSLSVPVICMFDVVIWWCDRVRVVGPGYVLKRKRKWRPQDDESDADAHPFIVAFVYHRDDYRGICLIRFQPFRPAHIFAVNVWL